MNHLHAIIRYHFFDFDVCVVIFNVSYIESFYEKYSMFGKSKILCMSFSVIETYDHFYLLTEESHPGWLGEKRERDLCAMPSPPQF